MLRAAQILIHNLKKIVFFLVCLLLSVILLYFVSYEDWMRNSPTSVDQRSDITSTTSPEVISQRSDVASTTSRDVASSITTLSTWKKTMTTVFWVGEGAGADNDFITNVASYWDENWQQSFGGVDSPECREGYFPCSFRPKENPFYIALPYAEYDEAGQFKRSAARVPWYGRDTLPLLKNRWIAVRYNGKTCYGQWQDVGPNNEDDFAYVFGTSAPTNTFGERAGLDISPALFTCLQLSDNDVTDWAFIDGTDVPDGPWKDIVTTSGISWAT